MLGRTTHWDEQLEQRIQALTPEIGQRRVSQNISIRRADAPKDTGCPSISFVEPARPNAAFPD